MRKHATNASACMLQNNQGPGQVYGEEMGKVRKEKMTAVAYGGRRGYEKRKKLDGRAHSRNSRRLPCPALGLAAIPPSWVNSFHQL